MADPLAGREVLRNRMKGALIQLTNAQRGIQDAIFELQSQDYSTEADALQVVLDDLKTEYDAIVIALTT